MPPTAHLYSLLPGGPVYPSCSRDRGQLLLREPLIHLGAWPPDLVTPEVPRYRQLVQFVANRLNCTLKDFEGYRIKMRYPPVPALALLRHELPEKPSTG